MSFESFAQFIPFLIPILLIQLVLTVAALVDLVRRERTRGPKWGWAVVILLVSTIGPIVYFMFGREE